ncbi:hypothetical protein GCM10011320_31390 [Neoroseomonas lacus]|uniref:Uncharacterized protein n=1 Tax=Neoroseomonas lacus TaxID=287609 RepID=A0A917KN83_9PROT|nr:hypothetical protein GCM10011320_31390 [Neoroseomonas lacus]
MHPFNSSPRPDVQDSEPAAIGLAAMMVKAGDGRPLASLTPLPAPPLAPVTHTTPRR